MPGGREAKFGPVVAISPTRPGRPDNAADRAAARRVDGEQNRLFLDAMFHGEYPADIVTRYKEATRGWAFVLEGDMAAIHTPSDFFGLNYYNPTLVSAGPDDGIALPPPLGPTTAMGWPIDPAGIYEVLTRLRREYTGNLPIVVSENGASFRDYLDPEGACHDPERVDFLRAHLREAHRALAEGVPLAGYFVWSLLDNFEWDGGYKERFGLVYTEYATQRRVSKDSYAWYKGVIRAGGIDVAG